MSRNASRRNFTCDEINGSGEGSLGNETSLGLENEERRLTKF